MKEGSDIPSVKPKYESNNEINLYSYAHQAILMPEDGKSFMPIIMYCFVIYVFKNFVDFMFDKDDSIEILSTQSQNNSRPESSNLEDRYNNKYKYFNEFSFI